MGAFFNLGVTFVEKENAARAWICFTYVLSFGIPAADEHCCGALFQRAACSGELGWIDAARTLFPDEETRELIDGIETEIREAAPSLGRH